MCMNKKLVEAYEKEVKIAVSELGEEPKELTEWRTWCINNHLPLVVTVAKTFYPQAPNHVSFLDMVQVGNMGLIEEVDQYLNTGRRGDFRPSTKVQERIKAFLDRESGLARQQPQPTLFA